MGMTRDEAIKIWNDPSRNAIDALVDLGVLKLDEPVKKMEPLELAMFELGFASFQAEAVRKQLEQHGFRVVEKNERELLTNTLLKIKNCTHASDSAAMAGNALRCVGALR